MTESPSVAANWQRISPLSIVFFVLGFLRQTVTQIIPVLAVALASIASSEHFEMSLLYRGIVFFLVLLLGSGVLVYLRFRYCLTDTHILLRKGVFYREELDIEFGRIQNVNITEPFYMRPFDMAVLSIDTAGSNSKELRLAGVHRDLALEIRLTILRARDAAQAGVENLADNEELATGAHSEGTEGLQNDGRLLIELSRRDVLLYGLTANFMLWAALAIGAFFGSGDVAEQSLAWVFSHFQFDQVVDGVQRRGGPILLAFLFILSFLLVLLLLPVISVIGALFRYDGFRLVVEGDTYRKSSGLLTRHDESIKQHKIQALVWKQNFIAKWLKRINLQLRQASAGVGIEDGQLPTGAKTQFLIPSLKNNEASELSSEFMPGCVPGNVRFSAINGRSFIRIYMLMVLIPLAIILIAPALLVSWRFMLLLPLVGLIQIMILMRVWRQYGYAVDGEYGYLRSGFIGSNTTMFPMFKVQRVDIRQTPLQRRKGLVHMTIHLASHSLLVPYVPMEDAYALRNYAMYAAESSEKAWF